MDSPGTPPHQSSPRSFGAGFEYATAAAVLKSRYGTGGGRTQTTATFRTETLRRPQAGPHATEARVSAFKNVWCFRTCHKDFLGL
jgi:hypothetical protein